ncbi:hypothetical protein [Fulvimonas soli]|jgi:hypothetical protein|uniref:Uncharacterized protein n=1 Tax=Fulvimonas soli TaxID=155197 RepID=A0A316IGZ0_9GAMM|nr:hypothetical protein [Fulvimonas soli]PWK92333.1 hypothetical protein C7456_10266 [Fulvimonas soli]TNY28004.1 hypothetical protein BV497_00405 [Fulvimonas soli]
MKLESYLLGGLFTACLVVCGLILGAMLGDPAHSMRLASGGSLGTALLAAPSTCALPADGVMCPRLPG